jgi:hypothetical protein
MEGVFEVETFVGLQRVDREAETSAQGGYLEDGILYQFGLDIENRRN